MAKHTKSCPLCEREFQLNILGYQYRVVFTLHPIVHEDQLCEGLTDNVKQCIFMSAELSRERAITVLWHEIIHAGFHILTRARDEEDICEKVSLLIYSVLLSNPKQKKELLPL